MQRWLSVAAAILIFMSHAQAREYFHPDLYFIDYAGTPNYPENYHDNPPIFDSISNVYHIDLEPHEKYFVEITENSIIGVELFYKDRKVGEVQNVKASPFPNVLFTDAKFFISEPGKALYSYPECEWEGCGMVNSYADTFVSLQNMTFTYWDHTANPVPEPETYAMLLAGLGLLTAAGCRRNKTLARAAEA